MGASAPWRVRNEAEGDRRAAELQADGEFYAAQKRADAIRVEADATAHAIEATARADAEQTRLLAAAIAENGQAAIEFEIRKRQVEAIGAPAAAPNAKTIVVPTNVTGVLGAAQALVDQLRP